MRILLVEDDPMIGEAVLEALHAEQYGADWLRDGESADTALRTQVYDAVLLDLGLPRRDGLDLLKRLRARKSIVPVLVITARDAIDQRVAGLDAGADDYLLKPFDLHELLARLRALLRRSAGRADMCYRHGDVEIDPARHEARVGDEPVVLSAREWAVLSSLISRPGQLLSRAQLEEKLYGWSEGVSSNAVEVHIHNLRRKLGADFIRNVRGVGYMVPGI